MAEQLPITDDQMRSLVIGSLQKTTQPTGLYQHVHDLAVARNILPAPPNPSQRMTSPGVGPVMRYDPNFVGGLSPSDQVRVQGILWDLIIEGIVRPGGEDNVGNKWPDFFHLTERGKKILQGKSPSPYDYNDYLTRIMQISGIDPVIVTYVTESLHTFRIGCYLASTVTLGCAAEKAMLLLMDATADAMSSPSNRDDFRKKTEDKTMKVRYQTFKPILENQLKPALRKSQPEIEDWLNVHLDGIFEIIRRQRNATGHPEGITISQMDADANLYAFFCFLKRVYALIEWLKSNQI